MPSSTYFEALGILAAAVAFAILGKIYDIAFLSDGAPVLFGAATGYIGGNLRNQGVKS